MDRMEFRIPYYGNKIWVHSEFRFLKNVDSENRNLFHHIPLYGNSQSFH